MAYTRKKIRILGNSKQLGNPFRNPFGNPFWFPRGFPIFQSVPKDSFLVSEVSETFRFSRIPISTPVGYSRIPFYHCRKPN